jgi:hypothetical protein
MNRFESTPNPLEERLSAEELREVLLVLGEADVGGDERATVGALVEATGADVATVLRILGEVRHRAIQSQRTSLEEVERRVRQLEERHAGSISSDQGCLVDEDDRTFAKMAAVLVAVVVFLLFAVVVAGNHRAMKPRADGPTYSFEVADGTVTMYNDLSVEVIRKDGTKRPPTSDEEAAVMSFALQVGMKEPSGR